MLIAKYLKNDIDIEKEILNFEKKYDILLPSQYKSFLKKYNGGDTPETNIKIKKFTWDVDGFYGIGNVEFRIDKVVEFDELLEKGWLPIANSCLGDYFAIGLNGADKGKIYFLDYGSGYRKKFLTDDLKQFIDYCQSGEIDPCVYETVEEREADLLARGKGANITEGLKEAWQEEIDRFKDMVREEVIID